MLREPSTTGRVQGPPAFSPVPLRRVEAVPNVSEGRRTEVLRELAAAADGVRGAHLLDWSADPSHNRSVFTMAGTADGLAAAVLRLFAVAVRHIDLRPAPGGASPDGGRRRGAFRASREHADGRLRRPRAPRRPPGSGPVRRPRLLVRRGGSRRSAPSARGGAARAVRRGSPRRCTIPAGARTAAPQRRTRRPAPARSAPARH